MVVAGVLVIGLSLVLGLVAFIALGSILLVLAGIVGIRLWWLNRKLRRQFGHEPPGDKPSSRDGHIEIIEGEYRDISRNRRER